MHLRSGKTCQKACIIRSSQALEASGLSQGADSSPTDGVTVLNSKPDEVSGTNWDFRQKLEVEPTGEDQRLWREHKQRKIGRELEEKEQDHELQMAQLQYPDAPPTLTLSPLPNIKQLPAYSSGDDVEMFLFNFETVCMDYKVAPKDYMRYLTPLVNGELAEALAGLQASESTNFELFKERARAKFGLSAEHFRCKFRSIRKMPSESYAQMGTRLVRFYQLWVKGCGIQLIPETEELVELMQIEQFLNSLPKDLRKALQAKEPKSMAEAGRLADHIAQRMHAPSKYMGAPCPGDSGTIKASLQGKDKRASNAAMQPHRAPASSGNIQAPAIAKNAASEKKLRLCYNCKRSGHLKDNCPHPSVPRPRIKNDRASYAR